MRVSETTFTSAASLAARVAGSGPLYALLDAARDRAILDRLRRSNELFDSLYAGRRARQLADVAPYLAQVSSGSPLLDALAGEGAGRSWGVLVAAPAPFAEVRRHFRTFLTVETEAGEAVSFRFYDPRVLRPFLASATEAEARAFFGPATALFVEGRDRGTLLRFERAGPVARAPEPPWDLPRVRDAQHARFSEEIARAFVERNAARLAGALAAFSSEPAAVVVERAAAAAERLGIEASGEVERFLDLTSVLGPGFEERLLWARTILLERANLTAAERLARLERYLRRESGGRRS